MKGKIEINIEINNLGVRFPENILLSLHCVVGTVKYGTDVLFWSSCVNDVRNELYLLRMLTMVFCLIINSTGVSISLFHLNV